ncbi:uncharacterized protein L201_001508 [Kwoniella dendrophila CBS 6074]|uniref:SRR1-like domain-containing protein n=1 Tax=Kwoniella dendrophila CBS 6074 TaxID=1295534 RepID=A0AAX4JNJ3_9TREE
MFFRCKKKSKSPINSMNPSFTPCTAPPVYTAKPVDRTKHFLELSPEERKTINSELFSTLIINKNNASTILRGVNSFHVDPLEDVARSQVNNLIIQDLDAAQTLTQKLDSNYLEHDIGGHIECNHPENKVLVNIRSLAFGAELVAKIISSNDHLEEFNIRKILQVLGCMLKPTHLCLAAPHHAPIHNSEDLAEAYVDWNDALCHRISSAVEKWNIQTLTTHGFICIDQGFMPPSIKNIRFFFPSCLFCTNTNKFDYDDGSEEEQECICKEQLNLTLSYAMNSDFSGIEEEFKDKKIELINLPHLDRDYLNPSTFQEVFMHQYIVEELADEDLTLEDLRKGCEKSSEWLKNHVSIIKKKEAEACICCGKK